MELKISSFKYFLIGIECYIIYDIYLCFEKLVHFFWIWVTGKKNTHFVRKWKPKFAPLKMHFLFYFFRMQGTFISRAHLKQPLADQSAVPQL